MRRRTFPNLITNLTQLNERQERMERIMQMIGVSPENPGTLTVNDGTLNRVLIGVIGGAYGIQIINSAGATIIFADGHITADGITTGTLDASIVTVTNLNANSIVTGTLSASKIAGGILNCSLLTMSSVNASWITTGTFSNINNRLSNGTISGVKLTNNTIEAPKIKANTITANQISAHTLTGDEMNLSGALITASAQIADAVITHAKITSINASTISTGTLNANRINVNTLNANKIINKSLGDAQIKDLGITYGKIASINASRITVGTLTGRTIQSSYGGSKIVLNNGDSLDFYWGGVKRAYLRGDASGVRLFAGSITVDGWMQCYDDLVVYDNLHIGQDIHFTGEGSIWNADIIEAYNDIRFLLNSTDHYHRFYGGQWNQKMTIDYYGNINSNASCWFDGINGRSLSISGSKNFRIDHPEDDKKYLQYAGLESPEVALTIRGIAKLANGKITVILPHHWELATEEGLNTFQITPYGDCQGLYVDSSNRLSFTVHECAGGLSSTEFCWQVSAIRKGFSNYEVEPSKEDIEEQEMERVIASEEARKSEPRVDKTKFHKSQQDMTVKEYEANQKRSVKYLELKKKKDPNFKLPVEKVAEKLPEIGKPWKKPQLFKR